MRAEAVPKSCEAGGFRRDRPNGTGVAIGRSVNDDLIEQSLRKEHAMHTQEHREQTIDRLNRLLRGELSAVETYQQALAKVSNEPAGEELRRIMADHETASSKLRSEIVQLGGEPSVSSGIWGSWAQLVEGTAKLFGPETALAALKQGESHGVAEYERGLEDEYVTAEHKTLIRSELLPQTQTHIQTLDRFISA